MLIKNKKIYLICFSVCCVTMVLGLVLSELQGAIRSIGDFLYTLSCIIGILLGSLRVYKDFLKWVFRKKENRIIPLSIVSIICMIVLKICILIFAVSIGLTVCLALPAFSCAIAFYKYRDELI